MTHYAFSFCGETLHALPSGALYLPEHQVLCVSDLHFGKAQRYAAFGGGALPPYETQDTLLRLDQDITTTDPRTIVCLGDSFDRLGASGDLDQDARGWIARLQAGRRWIWIEGNHDPGPVDLGGTHLVDWKLNALTFRHASQAGASGEISGHYHPKATLALRGRSTSRRCFIYDNKHLMLPAYGTYTGGLNVRAAPLRDLFDVSAICILTGLQAQPVPRAKLR